jgi:hypothetical protein
VIEDEIHKKEVLYNDGNVVYYRYTITRIYKKDAKKNKRKKEKGQVIVTGIGISNKLNEARMLALKDLQRSISLARSKHPDLENQKKKK